MPNDWIPHPMKLFFSHSSRNKPLLREIRSHLPKWLQPWIDEDQLLFGANLDDALHSGISLETDFFILFFCREAAESDWVRREVAWALEREKEINRAFVLPVLLDDVRDRLGELGLTARVTIDLQDYTEHGIKDAANRIADHIGGWLVKRLAAPPAAETTGPEDSVKVFLATSDGSYNLEFYEHFNERIASGKCIYITGDGFECADEEGERIAGNFVQSFRSALKNGASIVRIETKSQGNIKWARMLAKLSGDFGEKFNLYVLSEKKSNQMVSVCSIDPNIIGGSTVEMMLSTKRLFGLTASDLAGTAVFVSGKELLAQDLRERIISLTKSEFCSHLSTPDEIINTLAGEAYYFAFGSNLDPNQMTDRCPSAEKVAVGVLRDHELVFNRIGTYRDGGVASVQRKPASKVYGVIWKIDPIEFEKLDQTEDPDAYRRLKEDIHTMDGKTHKCFVYKANPEGKFEPDKEYLELLIRASQEQELPPNYIDYLRAFRS